MTKYCDSYAIGDAINQIIKKADEFIYILSPYLKISERYKDVLEDRIEDHIEIRLIYGKADLQPSESKWMNKMKKLKTGYIENLHAKCYMNENVALITSMNLYEFSQEHNYEMGILINKNEDPETYEEILSDVERLYKKSQKVRISFNEIDQEENGYCIRCKKRIELDPFVPYCEKCYKDWNKYENPEYVEKNGVCHICGKPHETTLAKPACIDCYKKNKKLFKI